MLSVVDIVQISQNYYYWNVASLTVAVTDYFICLPLEVELVWPTRWSPGKILYFATRYPAFIDTTIVVFLSNRNQSVPSCERVFISSSWFIIIGIVISEAVLVFRTYAVWERRIKLFVILIIILIGAVIFCIIFAHISLAHVQFGTMAEGYPLGCWLVEFLNPIIIFDFIIVLCFEIAILCLTLYKCRQAIKRGRSKLLVTLHRDAILYCLFIAVCSFANIINQVVPSSAISPSFEEMQRVMHSVLTSRILLNLRQSVRVNEEKMSQSTLSWEALGSPERGRGGEGRRFIRNRGPRSRGRSRPVRRGTSSRSRQRPQWNINDSSGSSSSGGVRTYLSLILDLDEETWTHDEESARWLETEEERDIEMVDFNSRLATDQNHDDADQRPTELTRRVSNVVLDIRAHYQYEDYEPQAQASGSGSRVEDQTELVAGVAEEGSQRQ